MKKKTIILIGTMTLMVGCATVHPVYNRLPIAIEFFDYQPAYEIFFTKHETMLLIFDDNTCVSFSSYKRTAINLPLKLIEVVLDELDKDYNNVKIIIHNHFINRHFSPTDLWFHHCAKLKGFRGQFQLYYVPENKIILEIK